MIFLFLTYVVVMAGFCLYDIVVNHSEYLLQDVVNERHNEPGDSETFENESDDDHNERNGTEEYDDSQDENNNMQNDHNETGDYEDLLEINDYETNNDNEIEENVSEGDHNESNQTEDYENFEYENNDMENDHDNESEEASNNDILEYESEDDFEDFQERNNDTQNEPIQISGCENLLPDNDNESDDEATDDEGSDYSFDDYYNEIAERFGFQSMPVCDNETLDHENIDVNNEGIEVIDMTTAAKAEILKKINIMMTMLRSGHDVPPDAIMDLGRMMLMFDLAYDFHRVQNVETNSFK